MNALVLKHRDDEVSHNKRAYTMKLCKVKIFSELNEYQAKQVSNGVLLIWEAVNENYDTLFESIDINEVIDYANENLLKVSHITKHTLE